MNNEKDNLKYKKDMVVGMDTDIFDDIITEHGQKIGMFRYNQKAVLSDIEVKGDVSVASLKIYEEELN